MATYHIEEDLILNILFSPPDITEIEIDEVTDALKSGWITTGPRTKKLENLVSEFCGTPKAVCLNSQTACAEMALRVFGIGEGDEVITTVYTYTATASVICHVGATPVFVDTQQNSLEPDYCQIEAAITEKTKAIIPVDIAGIPCDYKRLYEIAERKKGLFLPANDLQRALGRVLILADAAHSFGAECDNVKSGNLADFSAFSFHAVKNLTTAEGGALTWRAVEGIDNDEIYGKIQLLSLHGQSKDALAKTKLGAWEYDVLGTWYKCNMTDIAAALGIAQMKRYPQMLKRRREIVERYDRAFKPLGIQVLPHYEGERLSSGHLYLTRIPGADLQTRSNIISEMASKGISCNVHYKPLPMLTAYKNIGFDIANYPNAYNNFVNEVTLPLHTCLTDEQIDYIIATYSEIVKKCL